MVAGLGKIRQPTTTMEAKESLARVSLPPFSEKQNEKHNRQGHEYYLRHCQFDGHHQRWHKRSMPEARLNFLRNVQRACRCDETRALQFCKRNLPERRSAKKQKRSLRQVNKPAPLPWPTGTQSQSPFESQTMDAKKHACGFLPSVLDVHFVSTRSNAFRTLGSSSFCLSSFCRRGVHVLVHHQPVGEGRRHKYVLQRKTEIRRNFLVGTFG